MELNPFLPETIEDPYPVYEELRRRGPYQPPGTDLFLIARFDDVMHVLLHPEVFSSRGMAGPRRHSAELAAIYARGWPLVEVLTPADSPEHTWYRQVVGKAFSPNSMRKLEPRITRIVHELIDGFVDRGEVELVGAFARPFPLYVFADMVGIPREDVPRVKAWTDDRIEMLGTTVGVVPYERQLELAESEVEFQHYLYALVEERRRQPRDDLMTKIVSAKLKGFGGRRLTDAEVLSMLSTLLDGGNETTVNLIANGMTLLMQHPDRLEILLREPGRIENFVEESLRLESPVQCLFRRCRFDTELSGVKIPANARLAILYGAANRDESRFREPDRFDVRRSDAAQGVQFGAGTHLCLGIHLARMEGRVAFTALLDRLRDLRLAEGRNDFRHHPSPIVRGIRELHVEFSAA